MEHGGNRYQAGRKIGVSEDALIDFSSPKALDAILTYCMEKNVPAVL